MYLGIQIPEEMQYSHLATAAYQHHQHCNTFYTPALIYRGILGKMACECETKSTIMLCNKQLMSAVFIKHPAVTFVAADVCSININMYVWL